MFDNPLVNMILGCACGLAPLVLGITKKQIGTGILAFCLCAASAYVLPWPVALILAGVEFWIILQYERRARERTEAQRLKKSKIEKQRAIEELEQRGVTVVENVETRNLWPPVPDGRVMPDPQNCEQEK